MNRSSEVHNRGKDYTHSFPKNFHDTGTSPTVKSGVECVNWSFHLVLVTDGVGWTRNGRRDGGVGDKEVRTRTPRDPLQLCAGET